MKVRIQDGSFGNVEIEITGLKGMGLEEKDHIFDGIVEHCCESFSTNELREVVRQIEEQLGCTCSECQVVFPKYRKYVKMLDEVKEVIRKRKDRIIVPSYPCSYCHSCYPRHTMRARIERSSTSTMIVITGLKDAKPNRKKHIFDSIVEHCCESFSTNELREVVRQIEMEQLSPLNPQDIPLKYREILNEVKDVIRKRGEESPVYTHCCCSCLHYPGNTRPTRRTVHCLSYSRPYFGHDQVRCTCQLKVGQAYYEVHSHHRFFKKRFVLVREPYLKDGSWWIDGEFDGFSERKYTTFLSLSDNSVVPYEDGQWNIWNYMTFAEPRQMPPCCPHYCCPHHHC